MNTGGVALNAFELVTATYAADNFSLRDDWFGPVGCTCGDPEQQSERDQRAGQEVFVPERALEPEEEALRFPLPDGPVRSDREVPCFLRHRTFGAQCRGTQHGNAGTGLRIAHGAVEYQSEICFPSLAELDDRIDQLEDAIFLKADENQLQEIFQMKRLLVGMRKTVTPQRDAFASLMGGVAELSGLAEEDEHYFRDVYDHLIRISDLIDSYRDLLTGAMDVYLSTVSNRINAVMKQLTIIATIFLPLTFITGFFGQNFDWMVSHVHSGPMFLVLGVGTEIAALLALLAFFRRRGWF